MKKYSYKTLHFKLGNGFKWNGGFDIDELDSKINELGGQGWELVTGTNNIQGGFTVNMVLIFKKEA